MIAYYDPLTKTDFKLIVSILFTQQFLSMFGISCSPKNFFFWSDDKKWQRISVLKITKTVKKKKW